jgi:hypothetical protein
MYIATDTNHEIHIFNIDTHTYVCNKNNIYINKTRIKIAAHELPLSVQLGASRWEGVFFEATAMQCTSQSFILQSPPSSKNTKVSRRSVQSRSENLCLWRDEEDAEKLVRSKVKGATLLRSSMEDVIKYGVPAGAVKDLVDLLKDKFTGES